MCLDNFEARIVLIRGLKYVIVMVFKEGRLFKAYPVKNKSDILECLRRFMTDIGIPARICADCAGEYVKSE